MSGPPASAPDRTLLAAYARRTADAVAWDEMVGSSAELRPRLAGSTVAELLRRRFGVCLDFSHLVVSCLRSAGLAARRRRITCLGLGARAAGRIGGRRSD